MFRVERQSFRKDKFSTPQIGLFDDIVFIELGFVSLNHDLTFLKDITMGCNGEGFTGILFNQ